MSVNIGAANADDAFYRYKMPKLVAKIEGRGNGIKTNVVNMVDIAKALARPPSYTTKFFGCELGAQTKFDKESGTSIVNGAHDAKVLSELLEKFIKKFVQCHACGNPETVVTIDKRENIHLECKACGNVSDVDMRHKLCTFILKNPPEKPKKKDKSDRDKEGKGEKKEKKEKKDKDKDKEKKEKKEKKKKDKEKSGESKAEKDEAPADDAADAAEEEEEDDDDVQWSTDTSAAAVAARMNEQLTDAAAALTTASEAPPEAEGAKGGEEADDDEEEEEEEEEPEVVTEARAYASSHTAAEFASHVSSLKLGSAQERMGVAFLALFGADPPSLRKALPAKMPYLAKLAPDAASQKLLLGCVEHFMCVVEPSLKKEVAVVLKAMYDGDAMDEDVIIAWHKAGPKANAKLGVEEADGADIRKSAAPLVTWLEEAEEDSEDEDEE